MKTRKELQNSLRGKIERLAEVVEEQDPNKQMLTSKIVEVRAALSEYNTFQKQKDSRRKGNLRTARMIMKKLNILLSRYRTNLLLPSQFGSRY